MEAESRRWSSRMISGRYGSKLSVPLTVATVQRGVETIKSRNRV